MPANTNQSFALVAAKSVLDFLADLELFEVITPDQAHILRGNLANDVAGARDDEALTDIIGHWMEQLTAYNAVKARR